MARTVDKLTKGQALVAAARCLYCYQAPCRQACPAGVDVAGFINRLKTGNWRGAAGVISDVNILGGVCARVCPAGELCEGACTRKKLDGQPVAIAALQRAVMDTWYNQGIAPTIPPVTGKRVAVVGSGPAGLAAAAELVRLGHLVTLFEGEEDIGGAVTAYIPEYRLPVETAAAESRLALTGVEVKTGVKVGRNISWRELEEKYAAVFIGTGLGEVQSLGIPGEELYGVLAAEEFLALAKKGKKLPILGNVAVVGGGNTAMDAAVVAVKTGAKRVTVIYRRTAEQMPAWLEEYHNAVAAGVEFAWLLQPVEILGQKQVEGIRCQHMRLGERDSTGRPCPEPVPGAYREIGVDKVIVALGQRPGPVAGELGLTGTAAGIAVDERGMTSKEGFFAGGDAVNGGRTVVQAVAEGRRAARAIHAYLKKKEGVS